VGVRAIRSDPSVPGPGATQNRDLVRLRGEWQLETMSVDGRDWDLAVVEHVDLTLEESAASGWTGCQGYATVYTASAWGAFTVDPPGTSEPTCEGDAAEFSAAYLRAFGAVATWTLADDGVLELRGAGVTLTFSRAPEPTLADDLLAESAWVGTWRVESVLTPTAEVAWAPAGDMWVGIGIRRTTGSAGCNAFFGRVSPTGARGLFFDRLVIGLKTCEGDEELMRQESDLMDALAVVSRWDVDQAGTLILSGTGREVRLTRIGPPPALDTAPPA
jgi:heat shock protein HslJ